ncbi:MAG: YbhB/YbcL family Raf kinase inhibitor-like protein [Chlamydiae bacterium]|nr:YbhB/YbcL family Raf kinase inhibitor-like protein [Chlamydiota bacterium]
MASFALHSSDFASGSLIPTEFSCIGKDHSPSLSWSAIPENTKSLALIVLDPDAPGGDFTHWVLYNMPSTVVSLPKGLPKEASLPDGSMQGRNDFGFVGYGGPCPPKGSKHAYIFTLYALDALLAIPPGASLDKVRASMQGHILETVEIHAYFSK